MANLTQLLEASPAPVYAVDGHGVIVEANAALCEWVSLKAESVLGRRLSYHSEPGDGGGEVLAGLCPPPEDASGPASVSTLSTMGRDGRLRHRRARFLWLPREDEQPRRGVMVVAESQDLTPQELAVVLSREPTQDELHSHVRRFRRSRQEATATASMLGDSPAAFRLRSQFELAVRSNGGTTVHGRCRTDTAALARAIHYARQNPHAQLPTVDCGVLASPEIVRLVEMSLNSGLAAGASLLLVSADAADAATQQQVARLLREATPAARVIATLDAGDTETITGELLALLGPVRLDSSALCERMEDLPAIAQFFVERHNAEHGAHLGGLTPDALDQLALYHWPHGASQLGEAITEACQACPGPQVTPEHLPGWVRQAVVAASVGSSKPTPVVLEQLLEQVEREAIRRALTAAGDNKAEAARLLGLTRQRFYRRLENLGFTSKGEAPNA